MYTYVSSVGLTRSLGGQWKTHELADIMLREVYSKFIQVCLTVHDSFTDEDIFVNMDAYRTQLATLNTTVAEWLASMDGIALITIEELPDTKLATAKYANAILHGYKVELAKIGYPYPGEMPESELVDLKLTRPGRPTDLTLLHSHCLMTVNGYYHRTDEDDVSAFIVDGGVTAKMKRCSHTGILSFLDIGSIQQLSLRDEDITPLTEEAPLSEGIIIKVDADLTDKSLLFFLGGYMVQPESDVFYQIGDNLWVLNIMGLPYFERFMESRKEIDLSSLDVDVIDTNPDNAVVQASLLSDATILAYLKLSQTFIAVIDTPNLYYNRINVRVSNLPGLITAYQNPVNPLVMGYGKHVEYSKVKEADYWALRVADNWYVQYAFQTAPLLPQTVITDQYIPWKPYLRTQGYLLEIKGKKKTP